MTLYDGLLRLYPRDFREEYGEDMTLLLAHQLRDEGAVRIWGRTLLDLAFTIPTLHLEAHMSRSPSVPVLYGSAAVASAVLALVAGSAAGLGGVGVAGMLVFGTLSAFAWRRSHSFGDTGFAAAHWWKFLGGGAVALVALVVLANLTGELASGWWMPFMGALLTSVIVMAVGVILGITRLVGRRSLS